MRSNIYAVDCLLRGNELPEACKDTGACTSSQIGALALSNLLTLFFRCVADFDSLQLHSDGARQTSDASESLPMDSAEAPPSMSSLRIFSTKVVRRNCSSRAACATVPAERSNA